MYSLRGGHQHHTSKRLLFVEWLASFAVALSLVVAALFGWTVFVQARSQSRQSAASQTKAGDTCIVAGSQKSGSTPEVCPDR